MMECGSKLSDILVTGISDQFIVCCRNAVTLRLPSSSSIELSCCLVSVGALED